MKKFLLPEKGNYYKASLHTHSDISDGSLTPKDLKELYKEQGYSVLSITDHEIFLPHHDLSDDDFLMLSGIEIGVSRKEENNFIACHICMIALEEDNDIQPLWNKDYVRSGNSPKYIDQVKYDSNEPVFIKEHSTECINHIFSEGRRKGFFVTYNHPTWSQESYPQYIAYNDMNAMEIYNHGCYLEGYDENNGRIYDDMLKSGKRIYCVATDDTHGRAHIGGGFVMIKADKLEYRTITKALEDGNFYTSLGPKIDDLWLEGNTVHITVPEDAEVLFTTGLRRAKRVVVDGKTEATYDLAEDDIYFRVTVIGKDGKRAYTNAYFIDEIL